MSELKEPERKSAREIEREIESERERERERDGAKRTMMNFDNHSLPHENFTEQKIAPHIQKRRKQFA